ncbi:hypothetical protein [Pseudobacteriovorax antillogorgiicola]|uniref:Uncharacterized protein n=1 Tax=Pseudobacteriovorax antillogorgiicola TaxID=1513793 RepID=A0A1Y6BK48_9BACT|nr:hypothetical protein [Pseudobacteriovorax antillogorgiicola]TCS56287.1 hypothetical protein EDD56_104109 [Pseudobacteriovorax antillogorgiicola]SMF07580.1 hypothetical protein SAMN06296036_104224 [Pseudobacteriovorax antillogorgiicola]
MYSIIGLSLSALLLVNVTCAFASSSSKNSSLYEVIGDLATLLLFETQNEAKVDQNLATKLHKISHPIDPLRPSLGKDPSLTLVARNIPGELELLDQDLFNKHPELGRRTLLRYLSYCARCHARDSEKKENFFRNLNVDQTPWTSSERARFNIFFGDYGDAIRNLQTALNDNSYFKNQTEKWYLDFKRLLLMVITTTQRAPITSDFIKTFGRLKSKPKNLETIKAWQRSSLSWAAEKIEPMTRVQRLRRISSLVATANKKDQEMLDGGFIERSRAFALQQKLLSEAIFDRTYQETLRVAGLNAVHLDPTLGTPYSEPYFEACVRIAVKKDLSLSCLNHWLSAKKREMSATAELPDIVKLRRENLEEVIAAIR